MKILILFASLIFFSLTSSAQKSHKANGRVLSENADQPIGGASVFVFYGKDSLKAITDTSGFFSFNKLPATKFTLKVRSLGYKTFVQEYDFNGESSLKLPDIFLQQEAQMLKDVVIKGKINPVTIKEDTLEFNAAAFATVEKARLSELLKQLPGLQISKDGEVTYMGKKLDKMRVNGKEFFTGNLKDLMAKLPADLAARVQIIDDYGDRADFTGIKTGDPKKIVNIVTKDKKNSGRFGNGEFTGGTNKQFGFAGNANFWEDEKQISTDLTLSTQDNGAGIANRIGANASYNDKLNKNTIFRSSYRYAGSANDNESFSNSETLLNQGIIYNEDTSKGESDNQLHNFSAEIDHREKGKFNKLTLSGNFNNTTNANRRKSLQRGLNIQELNNISTSSLKTTDLQVALSSGYQIKVGRTIDYTIGYGNKRFISRENLNDHTTFYNSKNTLEDYALDRSIEEDKSESTLNGEVTYTRSLKIDEKNKTRSNISLGYSGNLQINANQLLTFSNDLGTPILVDSLSNAFKPLLLNQELKAFYHFSKKGLRYSLGVNSILSSIYIDYESGLNETSRSSLYVNPIFKLFLLNKKTNFIINFSQSVPPFQINQLQAVPDKRNLQRINIGNPNLKQELNQELQINFQTPILKTRILQFSLEGNIIRNNITTNILLVQDQLNGIRQEIHYLNARSAYNASGNFMVMNLFNDTKNQLNYGASASYSNSVYFTDHIRGLNSSFNFSQNFSFSKNTNRINTLNMIKYDIAKNYYSIGSENIRNVSTLELMSYLNFKINDSYSFVGQFSKKINNGYNFDQQNPFIVSSSINKFVYKKLGTIILGVNDLLNQGNNQQRLVSANRVTDTRSNQVTRYFYLKLRFTLDKFSSRPVNVPVQYMMQ
ncbi:hypothetical protein D3C87_669880 [compost metagenome]